MVVMFHKMIMTGAVCLVVVWVCLAHALPCLCDGPRVLPSPGNKYRGMCAVDTRLNVIKKRIV